MQRSCPANGRPILSLYTSGLARAGMPVQIQFQSMTDCDHVATVLRVCKDAECLTHKQSFGYTAYYVAIGNGTGCLYCALAYRPHDTYEVHWYEMRASFASIGLGTDGLT